MPLEFLLYGIGAGVGLLLVVVSLVIRELGRQGRLAGVLVSRLDGLERGQERAERTIRDEAVRDREQSELSARQLREEVGGSLRATGESLRRSVGELAGFQGKQLDQFASRLADLTRINEQKLELVRDAVERRLASLQEDNARQLEQMRQTVDDKLQSALEQRLGESFKLVSDRLEQVHKGLGEMQALASGVGDLKRVLSNVKSRGTWGEVQLQSLLEQVLAPEQYALNVATRDGSAERVEVAIRLPGRGGADRDPVWLPIDAKFPLEDYRRLVEASERADGEALEQEGRRLEARVRTCAKEIAEKYLSPPGTTDFAVMFLPTEGLYAEVLRRPGLVELLQRECRVVPAGPTTLWAILNSLQMGFRTLAIERRSSEVWGLLGSVKTEFNRFGGVLDAVQKKLQEASGKIDRARQSSRRIERRLQDVEELTVPEVGPLFRGTLSGEGEVEEPE